MVVGQFSTPYRAWFTVDMGFSSQRKTLETHFGMTSLPWCNRHLLVDIRKVSGFFPVNLKRNRTRERGMSLMMAVVVFVAGFISGTVIRWFAGVAAFVALILVVLQLTPDPVLPLVDYIVQRYYVGNELLFISGFLFGIDAKKTKEVVVERRGMAD
ncbi:hypothetical protein GCM10025751_21390 [Haladaptatus pallidirubidus]|uniref:Uncharacterized protein n=2 Tax=Haladaptatus pallidirubidus TaxID=1008152 RepID=A0AAV3UGI5_9EURY